MQEPGQGLLKTMKFVYAVKSAAFPGLVKIGRTQDMKTRLSQLNTACAPSPFVVLAVSPTLDYVRDEKRAHEFFSLQRTEGEFFRVNEAQVTDFFKTIRESFDAELNQQSLQPQPNDPSSARRGEFMESFVCFWLNKVVKDAKMSGRKRARREELELNQEELVQGARRKELERQREQVELQGMGIKNLQDGMTLMDRIQPNWMETDPSFHLKVADIIADRNLAITDDLVVPQYRLERIQREELELHRKELELQQKGIKGLQDGMVFMDRLQPNWMETDPSSRLKVEGMIKDVLVLVETSV